MRDRKTLTDVKKIFFGSVCTREEQLLRTTAHRVSRNVRFRDSLVYSQRQKYPPPATANTRVC